MYKEELALNNLQYVIYHKTKLNQIINIFNIYVESGTGIK